MYPSSCRYPGFAGRLGLPRATLDSTCNAGSSRTVGSNVEFGSSGGMLQVERVELLANALQDHPSLESLFVASALILCDASLLLLGLLRTNNSLLPEGRLEALELRAGHLNFGGCGSLAVDFQESEAGNFFSENPYRYRFRNGVWGHWPCIRHGPTLESQLPRHILGCWSLPEVVSFMRKYF